MAITFGRHGTPNSTTAASPIACAFVTNSGETGVVFVTIDLATDATRVVTAVTDDAAGGSSTYAFQGAKTQGNIRSECWTTTAGGAKTAANLTVAISGTAADKGIMGRAYLGVVAIGAYASAGAATGSPSTVSLTTQDANNWVASGSAQLCAVTPTNNTGANFLADGNVTIEQAVNDNTVAGAASVTCSINDNSGTTPWAHGMIELRTSAGGAAAYQPRDIPHSAQHQSMVAQ